MKFKIGDKVKVNAAGSKMWDIPCGLEGFICYVSIGSSYDYGVNFGKEISTISGHDCCQTCPEGWGYFFYTGELDPAQNPIKTLWDDLEI